MIINSNGNRLVISPQPFPKLKPTHDGYPSHGVGFEGYAEYACGSGKTAFFYLWGLKSGGTEVWHYLIGEPSFVLPSNVVSFENYQTPGIKGWWEGEAYNYVLRASTLQKMTEQQAFDYVNSH